MSAMIALFHQSRAHSVATHGTRVAFTRFQQLQNPRPDNQDSLSSKLHLNRVSASLGSALTSPKLTRSATLQAPTAASELAHSHSDDSQGCHPQYESSRIVQQRCSRPSHDTKIKRVKIDTSNDSLMISLWLAAPSPCSSWRASLSNNRPSSSAGIKPGM